MKKEFDQQDKLRALHELSLSINSTHSTSELMAAVIAQIVKTAGPDAIFFYLRQGDKLFLKDSWQSSGGKSAISPEVKDVGVCLCGIVASEKRPVYSRNIHKDPLCTLSECKMAGVKSFAALPLYGKSEIIGVLSLASFTKRDFNKESTFLEILSSYISAAMASALVNENLRETSETLQAIIDASPVAIMALDQEGNVMRWSPGAERIFGWNEQEVIGRFNPTVTEDKLEEFWVNLSQILRGETFSREARRQRKDGSLIDIIVSTAPLRDAAGNIIGAVGVMTDVTERKKADQSLRESEERLRAIFDSANEGILLADPESSKFHYGNRMICQMLGYTPEEIRNLGIMDIHPAEDLPSVMHQFEKQAKGELVLAENIPVKRKDGAVFHADIHTSVLTYAGKKYITGYFTDITGRKKAEEAMREAELRLSSLMRTASDAIIMSDASGTIISWNAGAEMIFGYAEQEALGKPLTMLMPERYRNDHLKGLERASTMGKSPYLSRVMDFHGTRKDGGEFPLELSVNAWRTAKGMYFLGIVRDFTEREKIKQDLEEQKRFAESLVENSAVATFVISHEHKVVIWNKACEELTGTAASEIVGTDNQWKPFYPQKRQTLADVVIEGNFEDLSSLYKTHSRSSLTANGLRSEGWYSDLNGKDRYLIFDAAPLFDSGGDLAFVVQTLMDITELKDLEKILEKNRDRLNTIINTEPHCVKLLSAEGTLVEMNPAGLAMLEADSLDQVRGKSIIPLIAPGNREAFQNHIAEVCRGAPGTLEFEVVGLKGTHRWLESHSVPFWDREGKVMSLLGITRDITEKRKLEDQLRQAQKMEAVGQLAGGVAHDFNNILSAIIGYGHLTLMKMKEDDPLRHNIEQILEASHKAATLTQSLLAFSRKQPIHFGTIDLNDLIKRFEKFLLRLIREDIELRIICADKEIMVRADKGQIEQVLMNLVTNARDAMPDGGQLTIETSIIQMDNAFVGLHGYGKPGEYALVTIIDTGIGMDEKTRERIFEPFFTTKEQGKGTGLGLAMVYGTIKQHGGFINVYGEPGKGTTFQIYLQIATAAEPEAMKRKEEMPVKGGTETILFAEDDVSLRKLFGTVFEQAGYTVIQAVDGQDAIDKFIEHKDRVHLVILDGIMPRMNGRQAYENIKALKTDISAIFMSGYAEDVFTKEGIPETGVTFIRKPVPPHDLLKKIRETLDA